MLELPGVTLLCVDTANHALALRAMALSSRGIRFGRTLMLTDAVPEGVDLPAGLEVRAIPPLDSREAYSRLVLKGLLPYVTTPHVLLAQWDGFVVNAEAWDDAFLACDYLGAKWFWYDDAMRVGNGGFSLRSRRLLEALQDPRIDLVEAEDLTIGRTFRPLLERERGIRFGTEALADRFAFEAAYPIGQPFGFHGLFNFCRVVPPAELAMLPALFSDAIARSPQVRQLLRNCVALGQAEAAIAIARRMLAVAPSDGEVQGLLAHAEALARQRPAVGRNDPCPCGSGKRYKQCHGAIGTAPVSSATVAPPNAEECFTRAFAAHQRGELDAAARDYDAALAAAPTHPHAIHYRGVIEYQRGNAAAALPLLERAVLAIPHEPEFHNNLGLALAALDRNDAAIAAYRRALALKPDHATAWNNLGLALTAGNALTEAIAAFRRALALEPGFAHAHWNLSLALLADGQFDEGWREYEWRLELPELGKHAGPAVAPRWQGTDPSGLTLLLVVEQGLGDAFQFVRFAKPFAERGARVIVRSPAAIARLLATAPGVALVVPHEDAPPRCDAELPLLSAAGALGIHAESIPAAIPYLHASSAHRVEVVRALASSGELCKVGLAWAGAAINANDRRRSVPLAALAPLLELPGISWHSLQKGDGEDQVARVPSARNLRQLPERNDFDRTAALIDALDLVISVDTSLAHLAGALARPVWIMLPFAPDWRWRLGRSDSPWYPTARLFRQPRPGDWTAVVAAVRDALERWTAQRARA